MFGAINNRITKREKYLNYYRKKILWITPLLHFIYSLRLPALLLFSLWSFLIYSNWNNPLEITFACSECQNSQQKKFLLIMKTAVCEYQNFTFMAFGRTIDFAARIWRLKLRVSLSYESIYPLKLIPNAILPKNLSKELLKLCITSFAHDPKAMACEKRNHCA